MLQSAALDHQPISKAPLYTGVFLGGMAHVAGIGIAAADGFENGKGWLALPVAGPWIALATRSSDIHGSELFCDSDAYIALVFDG